MTKAHNKKIEYERTEKTVINIDKSLPEFQQLILIITDSYHNLVYSGGRLTVCQYVSDALVTNSANKLHPPSDN